jgi:hypothetical protein
MGRYFAAGYACGGMIFAESTAFLVAVHKSD